MMNEKRRAPGSAATLTGAPETGTTEQVASLSTTNNSTESRKSREGGIASLLMEGCENGLHLSDLVRLTGWTEREVRQMIHQERRHGIPILSNSKDGYYLPGNEYEKAECVRQMRGRAREILAAAAGIERGEG